jgi:polyisoprenoid-binding protein YceI
MRPLLAASLVVASLVAASLVLPGFARAADYAIDPTHTHVIFKVDHLGFAKMVGIFSDVGGTIGFDPANVAASSLKITIKTDSLTTQFAQRDKDLKGADWFNVTEFPEMIFVGKSYQKTGDKTGTVTGDLTLHGVTRPVTLNVTLNKLAENPLVKKEEAGFSATATLKRSDFGMKTFIPAIGDEVQIELEVEAYKQ